MRMHALCWAPDDRNGGNSESFTSEESKRPDLEKPVTKSDLTPTPPDTEKGGQRISGPGPNDLTRGLP
ncbi:hypothetical protein D3C86_1363550 [compost metagenome]